MSTLLEMFGLNEDGGSGWYNAAFTHPDPMDPNDRVRQKTQSRMDTYPYDGYEPYGQPQSVDDTGAAYDDGGLHRPLTPKYGQHATAEAAGTPYQFGRSAGGNGAGGTTVPGTSRVWAGSTKDELDVFDDDESFGEGRSHLVFQEELPEEIPGLAECFSVIDRGEYGPEMALSLAETLDWEDTY